MLRLYKNNLVDVLLVSNGFAHIRYESQCWEDEIVHVTLL